MADSDDKGQSGKPDADRKGQPETSDKPKSLSSLLAEWEEKDKGDSGKSPSEPKGEPKGPNADDIAKRLERLEASQVRSSYEADMKSVVATVKGDLDIDDFIVESWVNRKADGDPRLVKLWEERDSRKAQFDEVIKSLAPEFQEWAKSRIPAKSKEEEPEAKDKSGKSDKGLAAAVRQAREASPSSGFDDVNFSGLSDQDFALKKAEVFRAVRTGALK